MDNNKLLPVAIIGAGPIGLAAAAHLALRKQPFILFEAGESVASNILSWRHIKVFSPWRYNIDKAAREILFKTNWVAPDDEGLPTGQELYDHYFKPLSEAEWIKPHLHLNAIVLSVGRRNLDKMKTHYREDQPFIIQILENKKEIKQYEVKAVIDSSGTWNSPNPIGSGGVYAVGEIENHSKIYYGIPDILEEHMERYKNKSVLIVGSGHSAINTILELDKLKEKYSDTKIHWVLRRKNLKDVFGGKDKDALEARGALGMKIEQLVISNRINVYTPFQIHQIVSVNDRLAVIGFHDNAKNVLPYIDEIISNTGSRPDFSFLREVRLSIDPSLESVAAIAELIDPNIHSCGTVRPHGEKELRHPDKDFYIVGSKSYGRAPTFLMATGYEQVRSIVAWISGDVEAAQKVELNLPETGVCSVDKDNNVCCGVDSKTEEKETKAVASACC